MVGIPFIIDQPSNVKRLVELGIGLRLDRFALTKESLIEAIMEVASNKRYDM